MRTIFDETPREEAIRRLTKRAIQKLPLVYPVDTGEEGMPFIPGGGAYHDSGAVEEARDAVLVDEEAIQKMIAQIKEEEEQPE